MSQLEADPEWVARRDERERFRQRRTADYDRAAAPLKAELAEAGFEVESIADLYGERRTYRAAVPILLRWLPRIEHSAVKESVVRALTVKWAHPQAAPVMLEELRRLRESSDRSLRFAVANALTEVADDSVFDDVVALARDRRYSVGERGLLTLALANMRERREGAIQVLRQLLCDDVAPHAVTALGELHAEEARAEIEPFLEHPAASVRKEAKKAIKKIDKK